MATPAVVVETTPYLRSHGKAPRGRGLWGFALHSPLGFWKDDLFWHNGAYGEAKAAAVAYARSTGADAVAVQP